MKNLRLGKNNKHKQGQSSYEMHGTASVARCDRCNGPLAEPFALIFTPAVPHFNCCKKKQICIACWENLKEWLAQ